MLGWSFPGVFVRLMPKLAWNEATALRLGIAMVAMLPIVLAKPKPLWQAVRDPQAWWLSSLMVGYYATATAAFYNAPIGEVALLIASAPAWAALWHYLNGHRDRMNELYGALVAIAGVAVVSVPGLVHHTPSPGYHPLGVALSVLTALCAAAYSIGVGRWVDRGGHPGSVPLGWITLLLGTIVLGPWSLGHIPIATVWPQAIGLGVLCTALPTIAYAAASERLPRGLTTIVTPAMSVTANVAAAVTIHEVPSWWALPGGLLVLLGVVMTLRR